MGKKSLKVVSIILIMLLLIFVPCNSFASGIIRDVTPTPIGDGRFENAANKIIGAMMWIGYACAIGMIIFIGIKYIIASADEKASLKGMLVKVVIGSIIIVGSLTITNAVISLMNGAGTSGNYPKPSKEARDDIVAPD